MRVTGTLNRAVRPNNDTVVQVTVTAGTATAGDDFEPVTSFPPLTIPAGQPSGAVTFTLIANDDDLHESDETVTVSGSTTGLAVTETMLTIEDTDSPPTVALTLEPLTIRENDGESRVTVRLSHASDADTEVTVRAADGAVTPEVSQLTITAGETRG